MKFNLTRNIDVQNLMLKVTRAIEGEDFVEFKKIRLKRSLKQNSYVHVVIQLFGIYSGYTLIEAKQFLKERRLDIFEYEKKGNLFLRSSADLDTKEMTDWIDFIRTLASMEYGRYIPKPEEYIQEQIYYQEMISQNQEFLNA